MRNFKLVAIFFSFLLLPLSALANNEITIINHYDQPLRILLGNNPTIIPDLHDDLIIPVNSFIKTRVQKNSDLPEGSVGYISTLDANDTKISAFWGVEVTGEKDFRIHTYYVPRTKLSYSWTSHTITFCTKAEYEQKGGCF